MTDDDVQDIKKALKIDDTDLSKNFRELPLLTWQYGDLEAAANEAANEAKATLEHTQAVVSQSVREQFFNVKITEAAVAEKVAMDPDYVMARSRWVQRDGESRRFRAVMEALRAQKDMLVQLGANQRQQIQAGMGDSLRG